MLFWRRYDIKYVSRSIRHPGLIIDVYLPTIVSRFLLVSLSIEGILGEVTIRQRRKKLEEMTQGNGLSDAYTATLSRLKAQKGYKSELGLKVLMWVLYSKRPLRADELCHALGVEIGSTDLDPENVPALRTLVASCLGLVTVEASSFAVRLVHFTLQEHLASDLTLFHSPHSVIAEVCLTYLNFGSVKDLPLTVFSAPRTMPFLKYASLSWWKHTRMGMTHNIKILALRLLDRFDEHISAQLLLRNGCKEFPGLWFKWAKGPRGFTGLHGVAFLGIVEIAAAVLDMKEWDVNVADCTGNTALILAVMRGHSGVVKILLEREDINPNQADTKFGRTPLVWAARVGNEQVVKMLLEREDVNPNQADTKYGQTLLSWAAENGHEGVVKLLLERKEVNPSQADTESGRTSLSWAAEYGHSRVVKVLLERGGVNPNQVDTKDGRTPLSRAAEKGHSRVLMMLLEREDINPNQVDIKSGKTPLSWAAEYGHEGVVKMLLELKDVRTATLDNKSQTPLFLALSHGHYGIAKIIQKWRNANLDIADHDGQTPLLPSAGSGDECVVDMRFRGNNSSADTSDPNSLPAPLSAHSNERAVVIDPKHSISMSIDSNLSTELSRVPQPPSFGPLKSPYPPKNASTHSSTTQTTLSFTANRPFILSSLICIFAFLLYILSSSSSEIFSFRKYLSGRLV